MLGTTCRAVRARAWRGPLLRQKGWCHRPRPSAGTPSGPSCLAANETRLAFGRQGRQDSAKDTPMSHEERRRNKDRTARCSAEVIVDRFSSLCITLQIRCAETGPHTIHARVEPDFLILRGSSNLIFDCPWQSLTPALHRQALLGLGTPTASSHPTLGVFLKVGHLGLVRRRSQSHLTTTNKTH